MNSFQSVLLTCQLKILIKSEDEKHHKIEEEKHIRAIDTF